MERVLINTDDFNGKYVSFVSADDNTIVGSGDTPGEALAEAKKRGIKNPFLIYIPDKDIVHIYYVD